MSKPKFCINCGSPLNDDGEGIARNLPDTPDQGWQDIATAPKDGARFLMFGEGSVFVGRFDLVRERWMDRDWHIYPTHWQPLPSPPEGE